LWLATVAMVGMGLAPAIHAGAASEKQAAHQAAPPPAKPAAKPAATDKHAPAQPAKPAAKPAAKDAASHGTAADTTHAAPAKAAKPAQASAVDVVKRIQSVLAKEQAGPADHAAGAHAASPAAHAAPKAQKPKPAPLLRWPGMPRPGDVTLTWDPAIRPGAVATPGVRLTWPADGPDAVQK
jgi:starch synthase